jgi:hypothetical protein
MSQAAVAEKPTARQSLRKEQPKLLRPSDLQELEFAYANMSARIPAGVAFEEILKPGFWANVVRLFQKNTTTGQPDRSGALIHVRTEDHAYYGQLYVRAVLERGLIVECVGPSIEPKTGKACPIDLDNGLPWTGRKDFASKDFEAKWNVGKRGFDIIRTEDQQIVADGVNIKTREAAIEMINKLKG